VAAEVERKIPTGEVVQKEIEEDLGGVLADFKGGKGVRM
jgi:hypothetical protein